MSRENVEVVRAALAASARGDGDGFMAALDPAIEWTPVKEDPDFAVHRGLDDVAIWLAEWSEVFPDMRWEVERIIDGGDRTAWRWFGCVDVATRRAPMSARTLTASSSRSAPRRSCGSRRPTRRRP